MHWSLCIHSLCIYRVASLRNSPAIQNTPPRSYVSQEKWDIANVCAIRNGDTNVDPPVYASRTDDPDIVLFSTRTYLSD